MQYRQRQHYQNRHNGWLMTYADMLTLLLTFFVLIVSFSSLQKSKFKQAAQSLQEAFGVLPQQESVIEFENPVLPGRLEDSRDSDFQYEVQEVEQLIIEQGLDREVQVKVQDNGVLFRIDAPFLFASGKAELLPGPERVLGDLYRLFRKFPYQIRIEGHTDTVPIASARYPSNWELSAARAVTVARYFQGLGMPPEQIAATGYGEFHPIGDNTTATGRELNRRVEILLQIERKDLPRRGKLPFGEDPIDLGQSLDAVD